MYRTVFWTPWEREMVGRFEGMALKHGQYYIFFKDNPYRTLKTREVLKIKHDSQDMEAT